MLSNPAWVSSLSTLCKRYYPAFFCNCFSTSYIVPPIEPHKHRTAPKISIQFSLAGSIFLISVYCSTTRPTRLRERMRLTTDADMYCRQYGEITERTDAPRPNAISVRVQVGIVGKVGVSINSISSKDTAIHNKAFQVVSTKGLFSFT